MATRIAVWLLLLVAGFANGGRVHAQDASAAAVEADIPTAPVELDGAVLFSVRGASALPAAARARLIRDRIEAVAADPTISVDSLRVVDSEGLIKVLAGDRMIMGIVEADASLEQLSRAELAGLYRQRIQQAIADHRAARSGVALRRAAINTLLGTLLLATGLAAVVWLWRRVDALATRRLQSHIHSVGIQSFEVVRADRIWSVLQAGLHGLRTVVLLASALVFVGYVLAQWPWTRGLSRDIVGFALAPLEVLSRGLVANVPRLMFLAVLFYVVRLVLRLIRLFFKAVGSGTVTLKGFDPDWAQPTYKILRIVVTRSGWSWCTRTFPGRPVGGVSGHFDFCRHHVLTRIVHGDRQHRCGLHADLPPGVQARRYHQSGRASLAKSLTTRLQVTHLRSPKNEEIVIPNSQMLNSDVVNYSTIGRRQGLILHTEVANRLPARRGARWKRC